MGLGGQETGATLQPLGLGGVSSVAGQRGWEGGRGGCWCAPAMFLLCQARTVRRCRQDSMGRTLSESSEGRGTASEYELGDEPELALALALPGGPGGGPRSRGDSAYLSRRGSSPRPDSPPDSEEDANGYVMPNRSGQGKPRAPPTPGTASGLCWLPPAPFSQLGLRPGQLALHRACQLCGRAGWGGLSLVPSLMAAPCPTEHTAASRAPEEDEEEAYEYMNRPRGARPASLDELGYEYMELGSELSTSLGSLPTPAPGPDADYAYMNRPPAPDDYADMRSGDSGIAPGSPPDQGYEDMEAMLGPSTGSCRGCPTQPGPPNGFLKPLRSLEASDCAFDNPDYWHSRLFTKADIPRT